MLCSDMLCCTTRLRRLLNTTAAMSTERDVNGDGDGGGGGGGDGGYGGGGLIGSN